MLYYISRCIVLTHYTYAGIHCFFGAFLAGMIVPKEGGLPDRLIPRIELIICSN